MKIQVWSALIIGAAMLFAGCSVLRQAQDTQPPIAAPGVVPQSRVPATVAHRGKSWMLPAAKYVRKLLYISDASGSPASVQVYNYKTHMQVGSLGNFYKPWGQCVDAKGDVWITDWDESRVVEFAHGGANPINTLSTDAQPLGCSVAPNGDLAVATSNTYIDVWKNASGNPSRFSNGKCDQFGSPGYDDKGNLYVQSIYYYSPSYGIPNVCELSAKTKTLQPITVNPMPYISLYGVMWDGKYIALSGKDAIYQAKEGTSGALTIVGTIKVTDTSCPQGTFVWNFFVVGRRNTPVNRTEGNAVLGGNFDCLWDFAGWSYPGGGNQTWNITSDRYPIGESVSIVR